MKTMMTWQATAPPTSAMMNATGHANQEVQGHGNQGANTTQARDGA